MSLLPVVGTAIAPLALGNNGAPRGIADIAVAEIAIQARAQTRRSTLDRSAANATDTLNDQDSSPTYDMHARVGDFRPERRNNSGHLIDRRV